MTITVYPTKDRILSVLQMLDLYRLIDIVYYFLKFVEYIIRVKFFLSFGKYMIETHLYSVKYVC